MDGGVLSCMMPGRGRDTLDSETDKKKKNAPREGCYEMRLVEENVP